MSNDLIKRIQDYHNYSNFMHKTPEVGGSHVALAGDT